MLPRRHALSLLGALAGAPVARAQSPSIRLGTTPPGGGFEPYSVALVETLKSVDPTLDVTVVETGGSSDNAAKLQAGTLDLGLVSAEVLHEWAAARPARAPMLPIVSVMYSTPGMLGVRADSAYHRIDDLRGRRVVWGPHGTGSAALARYVMGGLGLDPDHDFQPIYPDQFLDGPTLVLEGRAAALWGSGLRWPGFVQLADHPVGARFLTPDAAQIGHIRARYRFLVRLAVPAGTYPSQREAIETVGSWSFIVARHGLDDTTGHRLAIALHKIEQLAWKPRYLAQTTARNTLSAIGSNDELQPGVLRFYREAHFVE
jgi:TRAP transporter TAXI family solute receptor